MTHYVNVPLSETTYLAETLTPTPPQQDPLAEEISAFEALKPELLKTHFGEFVAIYQQQIVGFDSDEMNLIRRVYEQYGPVSCYVEKIVPETPRKVRVTSMWKRR